MVGLGKHHLLGSIGATWIYSISITSGSNSFYINVWASLKKQKSGNREFVKTLRWFYL